MHTWLFLHLSLIRFSSQLLVKNRVACHGQLDKLWDRFSEISVRQVISKFMFWRLLWLLFFADLSNLHLEKYTYFPFERNIFVCDLTTRVRSLSRTSFFPERITWLMNNGFDREKEQKMRVNLFSLVVHFNCCLIIMVLMLLQAIGFFYLFIFFSIPSSLSSLSDISKNDRHACDFYVKEVTLFSSWTEKSHFSREKVLSDRLCSSWTFFFFFEKVSRSLTREQLYYYWLKVICIVHRLYSDVHRRYHYLRHLLSLSCVQPTCL